MDQIELGEKINKFYYDDLKFCGCGRPEDTMILIRDLLNVLDDRFEKYKYKEYKDKLRETFEFENKATEKEYLTTIQEGIVQFVMYVLDNVGVLEHGGGIGGAWLSNKGKELRCWLNAVEDFDTIMN